MRTTPRLAQIGVSIAVLLAGAATSAALVAEPPDACAWDEPPERLLCFVRAHDPVGGAALAASLAAPGASLAFAHATRDALLAAGTPGDALAVAASLAEPALAVAARAMLPAHGATSPELASETARLYLALDREPPAALADAGDAAPALAALARGAAEAAALRESSLARLGADRARFEELLRFAPGLADRAAAGEPLEEAEWDAIEDLLALTARVDRAASLAAGLALARGAEEAQALAPRPARADDEAYAPAVLVDPLGLVQLGDERPTRFTVMSVAQLDLGGNDRYENNAGGADPLGLGNGTDFHVPGDRPPVSVSVDLAGDDVYEGDFGAQGGANYGNGLLLDASGNDRYFARGSSQGGVLTGTGVLADLAGNDRYLQGYAGPDSHKIDQGAGQYAGVGLLFEREGDDFFEIVGVDGQGMGGIGIGVLLDFAGNDRHVDVPQDLACGTGSCSMVASGVALGTGELGGLGVLLDAGGDDRYACEADLFYGCIGGATIGGFGLFMDLEGADAYAVPCGVRAYRASGLASADLASTAVFVDAAGADAYAAGCNSLAYATWLSTALFVDGAEADAFDAGPRTRGYAEASPKLNPALVLTGVAVFEDR